jgi:hypothetical protein
MRTSLNHQPEVHHPKSPAIRWAADYPIYASDRSRIAAPRLTSKGGQSRCHHRIGQPVRNSGGTSRVRERYITLT